MRAGVMEDLDRAQDWTTVSLVLPARLAPPLADDVATGDNPATTPDPAAGRLPSGTRGGPS